MPKRELYRPAIKRGAALLDEKRPGWSALIHTRILDMDSLSDCVLGQVEGDYLTACQRLGLDDSLGSEDEDASWRYGFAVFSPDDETWRSLVERAKALTRAWKRYLHAREVQDGR